MPLPIVGAAALAAARILAGQIVKQTGKKLTQNQIKAIAIKVASTQKGKVSTYSARKVAEKAAGPKAGRLGGNKALRATAPKPGVKLTTKTSGGGSMKVGPARPIKVKLTQRAEGPSRPVDVKTTVTKGRIVRDIKSKNFEKPPSRSREVTGETAPTFSKPKVKVDTNRPKPNLKKPKTNITVEKTQPRRRSDVLAERERLRRERLRKALTPRPKPVGPNRPVKPRVDKDKSPNVPDRPEPQGITVRGKFYPETVNGLPARGGGVEPRTISSRIAERVEKPPRSSDASTGDKEATILAQRSLRAISSAKGAAKEKIKPGVRTNTTRLIREINKAKTPAEKKIKTDELKRAIRNQRKVLREREIKQAAERRRLAEEKGN